MVDDFLMVPGTAGPMPRRPRRLRERLRWRPNSFIRRQVKEFDEFPSISEWEKPFLFEADDEELFRRRKKANPELEDFFLGHLPPDARRVRLIGSIRREPLEALSSDWDAIGVLQKINNSRWINKFFRAVNSRLKTGGLFVGCIENNQQRRRRILRKYPGVAGQLIYLADVAIHRVWPKLPFVNRFYFGCTKGRSRPISEAETLGRLVSCGFEIVEHRELRELIYFIVRKKHEAVVVKDPTYGPFCGLRRVGRGEELFTVYKLRTMHPYSEFLQEYVYRLNALQAGGKFRNDFRIPAWGKCFRRLWLDELPMVVNLLRGEMKLVGVRPLSPHYFSLYPEDFQKIRRRYRPGLLPPFYVDLPQTLEEIVESERVYLNAWEKAPIRTDLRYFCLAIWNILARKARSS